MPIQKEEHRYIVFDDSRILQDENIRSTSQEIGRSEFSDSGDFTNMIRSKSTSDTPRKSFDGTTELTNYLRSNSGVENSRSSFIEADVLYGRILRYSTGDTVRLSFVSTSELFNVISRNYNQSDTAHQNFQTNREFVDKLERASGNIDTPEYSFDTVSELVDAIRFRSPGLQPRKSFDSRGSQDGNIRRGNEETSNTYNTEPYLSELIFEVQSEDTRGLLSVSNFVAKLQGLKNVASPNKYWVEFFLPKGIPDNSSNIKTGSDAESVLVNKSKAGGIQQYQNRIASNGQLSMMCNTASLPGKSFATVKQTLSILPNKLPYQAQYDDITFTFTSSSDLRERKYFEVWMNAIINDGNGTINFYDEYISSINIYQLNDKGNKTYAVKLYEAYPIHISNIDYSYATTNSLINMSVTFTYKYWKNQSIGE
jgi:hypothetical protein